ncbi:hypothetical protein Btru_010552 [Bulinus truncatus]|nr:hypothetical protein Btru_010552 [Bulinus truncatus]
MNRLMSFHGRPTVVKPALRSLLSDPARIQTSYFHGRPVSSGHLRSRVNSDEYFTRLSTSQPSCVWRKFKTNISTYSQIPNDKGANLTVNSLANFTYKFPEQNRYLSKWNSLINCTGEKLFGCKLNILLPLLKPPLVPWGQCVRDFHGTARSLCSRNLPIIPYEAPKDSLGLTYISDLSEEDAERVKSVAYEELKQILTTNNIQFTKVKAKKRTTGLSDSKNKDIAFVIMPQLCQSCGETAVIEADIDGEGTQRICIECGTVCTQQYSQSLSNSYDVNETDIDEAVCESCGVSLPHSAILAKLQLCPECQALEEKNEETAVQGKSPVKSKNASPPEIPTCKSCGGHDLGNECLGADERYVCRGCGSVFDDGLLISDEFGIGISRASQNGCFTLPNYAKKQRKLKGLTAGLNKISLLHDKLCFPESVKSEANEMFESVFNKKEVFFAYIITKEHIAAACLFIACRRHDIPLSLTHFKPYLDKFPLFFKSKNMLDKILNLNLPPLTLTSKIGYCLEGKGFNTKIIDKIKDILFLCRHAWLTEGRTRDGLIVIAAYYAYTSEQGYMPLQKFRNTFNLPNVSKCLINELKDLFFKLASALPWLQSVNKNNLYRYIDDILKYRNSVFQLAFKTEESTIESDKRQTAEHSKRKMEESSKELLLPSILKKPRKPVSHPEVHIPPHVNLYDSELKETEFEDAEINSYLLTEEEQARIRDLKMQYIQ